MTQEPFWTELDEDFGDDLGSCPECGAGPDQQCSYPGGREVASRVHTVRLFPNSKEVKELLRTEE